eukprot:1883596-Amphidinium_carterae.1
MEYASGIATNSIDANYHEKIKVALAFLIACDFAPGGCKPKDSRIHMMTSGSLGYGLQVYSSTLRLPLRIPLTPKSNDMHFAVVVIGEWA